MRMLRFTTALAAVGLSAAFQAAGANSLSPNLDTAKAANSLIVRAVRDGGGHGGMGIGGGPHGMGMGMGGVHNFALGHGPTIGHGRVFAHHFHHGRQFAPFIGYGYDYPYWYDGGSCYWNCRNAGHGPGYCQAYAYNFCY